MHSYGVEGLARCLTNMSMRMMSSKEVYLSFAVGWSTWLVKSSMDGSFVNGRGLSYHVTG